MEKLYKKIGWKTKPNLATPLGATNLKKIDEAIDGLDNRTIELNNKDAEQGRHIEELYAETRNNTQAIEEVRESTQYIDSSKIVTNKSGAPVYIDDASNMNIENIVFYGESKQETTHGNQLLNLKANTSSSVNGLSVSVESGYILKVSGTPNNVYSNLTDFAEASIPNGKYTFSVDKTPTELGVSRIGIKFRKSLTDSTNVTHLIAGSSKSITLERTEDYGLVQIYVEGLDASKTYNFTLKVMLNAGTTALPWEKYSGGKPAPNPDYPQYIEGSAVGSVRVYRKNSLNPSRFTTKTSKGVTFTPVFKDGLLQYINANGTATEKVYYALTDNIVDVPTESLILNGCKGGSANTYGLLASYRKEDGTTFTKEAYQTDADLPIDTAEKKYMITIYVNSGVTVSNVKFYPMLRPTFFTDGTYEPYESQMASLTSSMYFLDGIGDLKNYIDIKRGVYVKKVENVVFDGSNDEGWATMDTQVTGVKRMYTTKIPVKPVANNSTIPNMLCSHYKAVSPVDTFTQKEGITNSIMASDGRIYVYVYDENFNTADISLWKAHLQANPMTVVYELAEPIETALSTEEMNDFSAMLKLHTYKPNTIVDAQDTLIDVQYVADLKSYVDSKFRELATVIVNQ